MCLKWCNLICCRIDLSQGHVWAANGGMYKLRYVPVFRSPQRLCSNSKYFIFIIPTKTTWTPCTYQFTTICCDMYCRYLLPLSTKSTLMCCEIHNLLKIIYPLLTSYRLWFYFCRFLIIFIIDACKHMMCSLLL